MDCVPMQMLPRLSANVLQSTRTGCLSVSVGQAQWQGAWLNRATLGRTEKELLDDSRLVSLTLSGDSKAYEVLVRRYQKLVYNVLYQMIQSHETASDLTQETFLKAFRALASFRLDARFKPWLLRIATNSGLNWIRDTKEQDSLEAVLEDSPTSEPAGRQDVEEEVEWRLSQAMLSEALTQLPARHRHVFILRYQHDLSYDDIADAVGEPETTIKSLLFRIRERLRKMLLAKMDG